MIWGYSRQGNRRHVLAEEARKEYPFVGIALCGSVLRARLSNNPANMKYWPVCRRCQTLLSAMESV